MATIDRAFDNIRLIRRQIRIAQLEAKELAVGAQRASALLRLSNLTDDLIRALNDFSDLGYEQQVADILCAKDIALSSGSNR